MHRIADDVFHLPLTPRAAINAYVIGDVLVDAGIPMFGRKIPGRLAGHTISAHTLTHAHPDHAGGSKAVCDALGVPMWAPAGDAAAVERGRTVGPPGRFKSVLEKAGGFPAVAVERRLQEGDDVAGFRVVDVAGHAPGLIALWRESDRLALVSDLVYVTDMYGREIEPTVPEWQYNLDTGQAKRSILKLAALDPRTVGLGHLGPLTGPDLRQKLERAAA